jgi:hypothetical protein
VENLYPIAVQFVDDDAFEESVTGLFSISSEKNNNNNNNVET